VKLKLEMLGTSMGRTCVVAERALSSVFLKLSLRCLVLIVIFSCVYLVLTPANVFRRAVKPRGTKVAIQTGGDSQNLFVYGPEEIQQLQDLRREALERMEQEKVALPLPDR
jgi:hypothetical protein